MAGSSSKRAKKDKNYRRMYNSYQIDVGWGAFKGAFVTHWNAVTTAVKRMSKTNGCEGRE